MAFKFKCINCDEDIITEFLKVGETTKCRSCGAENVVPETAVETDQEPGYLKQSPIISEEAKEKLQAKNEQARTERIQRITENLPDSPVSSDVEEPTSVASTDIAKANKRIKQAWIAGVISGVITLIAILLSVAGVDLLGFSIYNLIDAILIFGLAYGIYRKSRVCAVIMFVYFVGNRILMLAESGKLSGLAMAALFGYYFFQGIRGTFAYHTLEPSAKKLKAKTVLLVLGWVFSIIVVFFLVTYQGTRWKTTFQRRYLEPTKVAEEALKVTQNAFGPDHYNKAIEINPKDAVAYHNRGIAYYNNGQSDRAILDYNKAIEINPKGTVAYINRGNVYAAKGQYDRAISDYAKAIEINPKDTAAYINRGIAYYNTQRYDKAWDDVHKAQSLGAQIHPGFLKALREASGRQR